MSSTRLTKPRIAVGFERYYRWHERFCDTLATLQADDAWFDFEVVDFDRHDWLAASERFDCILWKSYVLGPEAAAHYKEKIYCFEHYLTKLVFPSFATVWHYESKVAQSYLLEHAGIPTPRTVVSFDYHDAARSVDAMNPPYVFKRSSGAGSQNVWLVEDRQTAHKTLRSTFSHQLWMESVAATKKLARVAATIPLLGNAWMRTRLCDRLLGRELYRPAYWQALVPNNDRDLRITVIGGQYAGHLWRKNRPHDFRASGSGLVEYAPAPPAEALALCFDIVRRLEFDSMAFDLVHDGERWLVLEMSYCYVADAFAAAPGIFERSSSGAIQYVTGSRWPQELWVRALLAKLRARKSTQVPTLVSTP
jgi:hypothetical protein